MIYERIYKKLSELIDFDKLKQKEYLKYTSKGLIDLHIDFLSFEDNDGFRIAIAHNYRNNGDIVADPDMEIRIFPKSKMAEALTFQQDNLGIFQKVYDDGKVDLSLKKDLNSFLDKWLTNIKLQDYILS